MCYFLLCLSGRSDEEMSFKYLYVIFSTSIFFYTGVLVELKLKYNNFFQKVFGANKISE